jgi:hypothetical protein
MKGKIIAIVVLLVIAAAIAYYMLKAKPAVTTTAANTNPGDAPTDTMPYIPGLQLAAHDVGGGRVSYTADGVKVTGVVVPCAQTLGGLAAHSTNVKYGQPCFDPGTVTFGPPDGK